MSRVSYPRAAKNAAINNIRKILNNLDNDEDYHMNTNNTINVSTPTVAITPVTSSEKPVILEDIHNILKYDINEVNRVCQENKYIIVKNMKNYLSLSEGGSHNCLKVAPDMLKYIMYNPYILSFPKFNATVKAKVDEFIKDINASKITSDLYKEQFKGLCIMVRSMADLYGIIFDKDIFNNNLTDIANKTKEFTDSLKTSYPKPDPYPVLIIADTVLNNNIRNHGEKLSTLSISSNYRDLVEIINILKYDNAHYLSRGSIKADKFYKFSDNVTVGDMLKQFYGEPANDCRKLKDMKEINAISIHEKGAILYKD